MAPEQKRPHWAGSERRSRSASDFVRDASAFAGAALAVIALGGWLLDALPFAKAQTVQDNARRIESLESKVDDISLAQQETLELQLMDRISRTDDEISREQPGTERIQNLREAQRELRQRLDRVQSTIRRLRNGD